MAVPGTTITTGNLRTRITIPATGDTLANIIKAAEPNLGVTILTVEILGRLPSGLGGATERGHFVVADHRPGAAIHADDYLLRGQPVLAGEDYTSPSEGDLSSYLRAVSDTPAIAIVYW